MPDWEDENWEAETETPYVNWWREVDGQLPANIRDFEDISFLLDPLRMSLLFAQQRSGSADITGLKQADEIIAKYGEGKYVPLPKDSANPAWPDDPDKRPDWITPEVIDRLPDDIPDDAVIVAVIDTGVALGHQSFRLANGETRVISAWQQTSEFKHQSADYLPFGEEWYAGDINGKLRDHSRNRNPFDRLDEDGFNRALRLVEPTRIRGHRDLDHRAAHGTHIMDIAAGCDPTTFADADRLRMIVVNLPTQYLHGYAGNFLEFFAGYAIVRAFDIATALWRKKHGKAPGGYPVALNFAYGMMAGPKDGTRLLEELMDSLVSDRQNRNLPTSICMPAGNENLARSVARLETGRDNCSERIPWRILPSDRTSNHIEFWFSAQAGTPKDDLDKYVIEITLPSGRVHEITGAKSGHYFDIPEAHARLYCLLHPNDQCPTHAYFMLATSPTLIVESDTALQESPAGLWGLRVKSPVTALLTLNVQSDQSATTQSHAGLPSYLDHRDYRTHTPEGRIRDTFSYELGTKTDPEDLEAPPSPVTRKGTHNALATTTSNTALAGFRRSDRRPADYSATSFPPYPQLVREIQAAYPTDDSPALYGVLAAGARDGSSVAFRGTSMAAAMATRAAANAMLKWTRTGRDMPTPHFDVHWHEAQGSDGEKKTPCYFGLTREAKTGAGRIMAPEHHRSGKPPRR